MELRTASGRRLAYEEFGDPAGSPLVHCHGWGDSRLTRHPDDSIAAGLGVRLLTLDRPGAGGSDPDPDRSLSSWVNDVVELVDSTGIDEFAVSGHSGGGPHALAVAAAIPRRVTRAAVVCGWAPVDRPGGLDGVRSDVRWLIRLGRRAPWAVRCLLGSAPKQYRKDPERAFAKQFANAMPECDKDVLADPAIKANILDGATESVRQGAEGLVQEALLLFARPWDIDLAAIISPVDLWYGADDTLTPPQMGQWLEGHLADAELRVAPAQGHLVLWTHWQDILRSVAGCDATGSP